MNSVIEERAVSDPEVAQFVRDEIANIEAETNAKLREFKQEILEKHRAELEDAIKNGIKVMEKARLDRAYIQGIKKGFTTATVLFLVVSVVGYLVIV